MSKNDRLRRGFCRQKCRQIDLSATVRQPIAELLQRSCKGRPTGNFSIRIHGSDSLFPRHVAPRSRMKRCATRAVVFPNAAARCQDACGRTTDRRPARPLVPSGLGCMSFARPARRIEGIVRSMRTHYTNAVVFSGNADAPLFTDFYVEDGLFVAADEPMRSCEPLITVDLKGAFVMPAFIDAHVHIESAMLVPEGVSDASRRPHDRRARRSASRDEGRANGRRLDRRGRIRREPP